MTISWYPGHMFKANKEMARIIKEIDVVIEILDARMPAASANPLLRQMRGELPCLQILNKSDTAQPEATRLWLQHLNARPNSRAIANGSDVRLHNKAIVNQCELLVNAVKGERVRRAKRQAMIVGIPNVGKSTLMNQISGRKVARTGNEPAVTKGQQRIKLNDEWYLLDTPGVLWPKLEDQAAAYRLACTGAIRNTAMEFEDVALFAATFLLRDFPDRLRERYRLSEPLPATPEALLEAIALSKGYVKGGHVDWHRVSELLLHEFRSGKLGRMTLEYPAEEPPVQASEEFSEEPSEEPPQPDATPDN